jgi:probable HAF family extracellular repeat protein
MDRNDIPMDTSPRPAPGTRRRTGLRGPARLGVAAVAAGTVAGALLLAGPAFAATASHSTAMTSYTFSTLDNQNDLTFNQLLGINNHDVISGYFGSGATGHPNKGYLLDPPYGQSNYVNENFPGSAQTQVTGLNNKGDTCGFWVNANNTNRGFVEWNGVFTSYTDPHTPHMAGSVNQLLGINNLGVAVGFYNDANGNSHAYEVNQATDVFTAIKIPGGVSTTATGINNNGDIVGFSTDADGNTTSWLLRGGQLTTYQFPGGSDTEALGVNNNDEIVGSYLDGSGVMHGFTLKAPLGPVSHWQSIDDPNGIGSTVVNGLNNAGDLVGFYTDSAGNTDGMLATPTAP